MKRLRSIAVETWLPIAILVFWWFASANSTSPYWPSLQKIATTFREVWLFDRFATDLLPSMGRFALGFAIAAIVGVGLGIVLGLSPIARRGADPIIDFMRSLPKPALIPILIVLLGIGTSMKVFIIAFSAVWPILLNTIDGVRATEPDMIAFAKVYGLSRRERIFKIVLRAASPQIFVGARLSLAIALILMVVSEMMASTNGLGYFILLSQQTFAIPEMWSGIILLGVIGYVTNLLFVAAEHRALAWHRGWRAASLGQRVSRPVKRSSRSMPEVAGSAPDDQARVTSTQPAIAGLISQVEARQDDA